jgi:hypothetical protein
LMGGGFSVWGSRVSGGIVWWRVCWRWLIGVGKDVGVCFVCGCVLGCGVCPWRDSLGVRLPGGLLVRVRFVDVVVKGKSGCDLLGLLEACGFLRLPVFCCVSGGKLYPVAYVSSVVLLGRLRLILYVFCWWWFVHVVVRFICIRFWSGVVTEGEYWITGSPRVVGWGCDIARAWVIAPTSFSPRGVVALSSGACYLVAFVIP